MSFVRLFNVDGSSSKVYMSTPEGVPLENFAALRVVCPMQNVLFYLQATSHALHTVETGLTFYPTTEGTLEISLSP